MSGFSKLPIAPTYLIGYGSFEIPPNLSANDCRAIALISGDSVMNLPSSSTQICGGVKTWKNHLPSSSCGRTSGHSIGLISKRGTATSFHSMPFAFFASNASALSADSAILGLFIT